MCAVAVEKKKQAKESEFEVCTTRTRDEQASHSSSVMRLRDTKNLELRHLPTTMMRPKKPSYVTS